MQINFTSPLSASTHLALANEAERKAALLEKFPVPAITAAANNQVVARYRKTAAEHRGWAARLQAAAKCYA